MNSSITRVAALAVGGFLAIGATSAHAKADLRVNLDEMPDGHVRTEILNPSCAENEPLATVRIAIENIGPDTARTSAIVGGIRDVVTVEAVDAPFTRDKSFIGLQNNSANNIDSYEIAIFEFEIGKNMLKAGRIGEVLPGSRAPASWNEQRNMPVAQRRAIQRALTSLGFDTRGTNGSFGNGTRAAIEAFQRDMSAGADGVLTSAQMAALRQRSGESGVPPGFGQTQEFQILVIVDPANRIDESDESNNKWKSEPIAITCGR